MSTTTDAGPAPASTTGRRLLAGAVFLGVVNALWALFQWAELLLARAGSTPFCAVDETFNCAQVWDSAFAVVVHDVTQVPIAGWGLAWGIVATVLPLVALTDERLLGRGVSAALRFVALAGFASVAALATASVAAGALCIGCLGTYALVIAWGVCAWRATKNQRFAEPGKGAALAAGLAAVTLLLLVIPGQRTPHAEKKLAIPAADDKPAVVEKPASPTNSTFLGPPTGDPARDDALTKFMATLDPQAKQVMSDLLAEYRAAKPTVLGPPRELVIGDEKAPLRITEWTDPLCPHCALLHATLTEIEKSVPPGLFSVEARHFPLDGFCNSGVQRKSADGVRCIGALAQICLEGDAKHHEASGRLFEARAQTVEAVYETLKPFREPAALKKCVESAEAKKKLEDDIAAALGLGIEGTPLVLLNGREVRPFGPLLYALVLTGGADAHPAFADLPPPRPKKEAGDGHDGHAH